MSGMHPEQKRIFQQMTPEQKLRLLMDLQLSARKLKAVGFRKQHPGWTEAKIKEFKLEDEWRKIKKRQ